ncbi:MAG: glycogen synthase [Bacteroidetes bacterium]|nr:MAG: glycogen synthase [Bacteroidota bacterium]TAG88804.1 MAG: glycogen synthase [Bacteroidota bacterium]
MEIIHFSAECYPVAKVGGLGDVVGALPKYQCKAGHYAKVVMPAYNTKFMHQNEWQTDYEQDISMGGYLLHYKVLKEKTNKLGFDLYCILIDGLTNRDSVYAENDDTERFLAFQIAALDWISQWKHQPDVLHCHDHHTALIPFMVRFCGRFHRLQKVKTVFTIHNGLYQGWFGWSKIIYLPLFEKSKAGLLEWSNMINPMSSAVRCADAVTTVSKSYMYELMQEANGLEQLFAQLHEKCYGILNGIDFETWNPEKDTYLTHHYNETNVHDIKKIHKKEICDIFGLNEENPLIVFIGRLMPEKGADLLAPAMGEAMYQTEGDVNFLVLGSGADSIENELNALKPLCEGIYNVYIGYNEGLAHRLYAAADFILMPSRTEPCGLNQMYALRYGTIPIVRRTGGLQDTVKDFGEYEGFGICFDRATQNDIVISTRRALLLYHNQTFFHYLRSKIMSFDNSWEQSQKNYEKIYQSI